MKVVVMWENPSEEKLASNLVAVLRKIGAMLVYGKVNADGVMLEDWASKPRVKMECLAAQAPPKMGVEFGPPLRAGATVSSYTYGGDIMPTPGSLSVTRELMRDLVRMFPDEDKALIEGKRKPVVPKPNTTETGVTVRQLDMWDEEGEH